MSSLNHIHSYERVSKNLWRCTHPLCTHTLMSNFILGKASRCDCGAQFVITREHMRRKHPKCLNCSKTKEAKNFRRAKEVMDQVLSGKES